MKKTLLAFLITGFSLGASAQNSLSILSLNHTPWGSVEEATISSQGTVENTYGTSTIYVKARRFTIDTVPGTLNYFCWGQCYEPPVDVSPDSMSMDPGQRIELFYADYKPQGNAGVSTLAYCFYDAANEADSICATVRFSASPTGILDVFQQNESGISESYPNPAKGSANINYALEQGWQHADITVYSMLGTKVRAIKLIKDQGTVKLDVSELPSGMYFYTLTVNGNDLQTRKMLVTR